MSDVDEVLGSQVQHLILAQLAQGHDLANRRLFGPERQCKFYRLHAACMMQPTYPVLHSPTLRDLFGHVTIISHGPYLALRGRV